jgi:UDP-N-acetylglucosamine--N-acetylmuramyl-(pentapeptide) pyrophosphoryl-undecaprenol N-acetylglucosamine transferase
LVYLPDIEPGLAVRFLARVATKVAVTVEESRSFLPAAKVVVTGYPLGARLRPSDSVDARASLGLDDSQPVLLVMGGSTGARSINLALDGVLEEILELAQVVHVTGEAGIGGAEDRLRELGESARARYRPFAYLHEEMGLAFEAADLVVARSGASTLGELPAFGVPAVLVPYPHAWRYQRVNADWLAVRGAAVRLDDERLADELLPTVRRLLENPAQLRQMRQRMAALARPDAATKLASVLGCLAGQNRCVANGPA